MSVEDAVRKHLAHAAEKYRELLERSQDPEIASDHLRANAIRREMGGFSRLAEIHADLLSAERSITEARELLELDEDEETRLLVESEIEDQEEVVSRLISEATDLMLTSDGHSGRNVIMEIRAGTGGDEAGLFAGALFRMYSRW
jgi:peptide chain release factor 1